MQARGFPYALRARLRHVAESRRVHDCGQRAIHSAPELVITEYEGGRRRAHWDGVLRCGRQHACPVCAMKEQAARAAELDAMMRAAPGERWQMVTFTLRHFLGQPLAPLLKKLRKCFRRVRAMRRVRDVYDRRVTATARALEVTWGKNGFHPHIHLLLCTSEWTPRERRRLLIEWARAVGQRGNLAPLVVWSRPIWSWVEGEATERARYLCKLGAEVAGVAKLAKNGNLTPWQVAEQSLTRPELVEVWSEYQRSMKGQRILELDERAKALAKKKAPPEVALKEWRVPLYREEFSALAAFEKHVPTILWELLENACVFAADADPKPVVESMLHDVLEWRKKPPKAA